MKSTVRSMMKVKKVIQSRKLVNLFMTLILCSVLTLQANSLPVAHVSEARAGELRLLASEICLSDKDPNAHQGLQALWSKTSAIELAAAAQVELSALQQQTLKTEIDRLATINLTKISMKELCARLSLAGLAGNQYADFGLSLAIGIGALLIGLSRLSGAGGWHYYRNIGVFRNDSKFDNGMNIYGRSSRE